MDGVERMNGVEEERKEYTLDRSGPVRKEQEG